MSVAQRPAVLLSCASQDAEAARGIGEALHTAGVEVWFARCAPPASRRLASGETPPRFCERVTRLLDGEVAVASPAGSVTSGRNSNTSERASRRWLGPAVAAGAALIAFGLWRRGKQSRLSLPRGGVVGAAGDFASERGR